MDDSNTPFPAAPATQTRAVRVQELPHTVIADGASLDVRIICTPSHPNSKVGMIFLHPYALLGGEMNNNVVVALHRHFGQLGYTTARLNFRGVGKSKGRGSWRGNAEREDVIAVCKYLLNTNLQQQQQQQQQEQHGSVVQKVLIVGYSYGSGIGCSCVNELPDIIGSVAISYPFGPYSFLYFGNSSLLARAQTDKPSLFIMGTSDNFTSISNFTKKMNNPELFHESSTEISVVKGMDHFWFGEEDKLCDIIHEWLQRRVMPTTATTTTTTTTAALATAQ